MLGRAKRLLTSPSARLRLGICLWAISWLPIAQIVGAHDTGRLLIWGLQILIGIAGVALAGSSFFEAVKKVGWRRAPGVMWRGLIHGDAVVVA